MVGQVSVFPGGPMFNFLASYSRRATVVNAVLSLAVALGMGTATTVMIAMTMTAMATTAMTIDPQ
jgi:hypothetical protein